MHHFLLYFELKGLKGFVGEKIVLKSTLVFIEVIQSSLHNKNMRTNNTYDIACFSSLNSLLKGFFIFSFQVSL